MENEATLLFDDEEEFVYRPSLRDVLKRKLTAAEIEYVLSPITSMQSIPPATALSIMRSIKDPLRHELAALLAYPQIIPKLRHAIESNFEYSKISSGENIGITAAQSFGQFYTQSTLNTFHTAGLAVKAVVTGVVRFEEILQATSRPKGAGCSVKFKCNNSSILELRERIKGSIVYFDIAKLGTLSYSMYDSSCEPDWYEGYELLYNNRFRQYAVNGGGHYAEIVLNRKLLYEYLIKVEDVANRIEEKYADLICVFSPLHIGIIHVYVDVTLIDMPEEKIHYVTKDNMVEIYITEIVIPNLEELYISGVKGVENAFFINSDSSGWYIDTEGGKFDELLAHPDVDSTLTTTNHIWDIYYTLGVEAARQHILEELTSIMPGISNYHSKFLVDYMTRTGTIVSISRYTMRSEGSGALSKASFEETLDNLINAGLFGESENASSVSTSIICGKLGSFGTGVCELKIDVDKLRNVMSDVKEKVY